MTAMTETIAPRIGFTRSKRRLAARTVAWAALLLMVVVFAFPFVYLVLTSFKLPSDTVAVPPTVAPTTWTLENYVAILRTPGVVASLVNSLSAAALCTVFSLALGIPAAYGATRFKRASGKFFLALTLLTRLMPPIVIGLPLPSALRALGLGDTSIGLALAQTVMALPLTIWLVSSFLESVPFELEEAAMMDGAGPVTVLRKVIIPVISGGVAVAAIFAFLTSWNDLLFALLLTSTRAATVPISLANLQTVFNLQWGSMTALSTIYSVPMVVLTLFLQRKIVAGMTLGAVK